jgi:hypothetical protein
MVQQAANGFFHRGVRADRQQIRDHHISCSAHRDFLQVE